MTKSYSYGARLLACAVVTLFLIAPVNAHSVDKELLKVLLSNGAITKTQHEDLLDKLHDGEGHTPLTTTQASATPPATLVEVAPIEAETVLDEKIADQVAQQVEAAMPIRASHGSKGFRLETRDGNWQTNLQWRGQLRYTNPSSGDPRQLSAFDDANQSTFRSPTTANEDWGPRLPAMAEVLL